MNECEVYPKLYGKDKDKYRNSLLKAIEANVETDLYVRKRARMIYESCYQKHLNPLTLYDNSFLEFVEGNAYKSAEIAEKYIQECKNQNIDHQSSPAELMLLGQSYVEIGQYFKAIDVLSDLIQKEPTNKKAYFHRAVAYFETGNFDEALLDFISTNKGKDLSKSSAVASKEFTQALITSIREGASESVTDFVPSLCNSVYGLSTTLWAMHRFINPLNPKALRNFKNFANASYEIGESIVNYCKSLDAEKLDNYVDQIKILYQNYDQLSDNQKGELIGYTIGRYSIDIFAGAAMGAGANQINKVMPLFSNLRNANRLCNLETMTLSEVKKKAIIVTSLKHSVEREEYFKKISMNWTKQNKHINGQANFEIGKGIVTLEPSEFELLVKKNAGKGERVRGGWGEVDYRERVDFGKIIGEFALEKEGKPIQYIPTSKCILHYDKSGGVHAVPSNPNAFMN